MFTKKWLPSPFFKSRGKFPLDMIIIHHIGSKNGKLYSVNGTLTWFTDIEVHRDKETGKIKNKVSAHYVVPRDTHDGNDVYHLVEDLNIAYHAGVSQWTVNNKLRKYINRYSIGIELEGDGNLVDYEDYQYEVLVWLVRNLMDKHNIKEENIVGHEDIAPGRKVDPGKYFDWRKFRSKINPPILIPLSQKRHSSLKTTEEKTSEKESKISENANTLKFVKDEDFYMGDGSETDGGFILLIKNLIEIVFKIFKIK